MLFEECGENKDFVVEVTAAVAIGRLDWPVQKIGEPSDHQHLQSWQSTFREALAAMAFLLPLIILRLLMPSFVYLFRS
jgi:hypothetical protein